MKRDNWEVKDYGIRPAGSPTKCFYCDADKGGQHKEDCVIRRKTVVVEMKVQLVVEVPEDYDKDAIHFRYNEGTYCMSNMIEELQRIDREVGCLCQPSEIKYIREATKEDEDEFKVYVDKIES